MAKLRMACISLAVLLMAVILVSWVEETEGFIVFLGNTTACDTCDEYQTYSGRNVLCCLAQSKCCGPASFDDIDSKPT